MKIWQATVWSLHTLQANDEVRLGLKNQGLFIISRCISYQIPGPNL